QKVHANDVLISTVRTYLKNIAIVPEYLDGQVASTGFCVLRPHDKWHSRYIYYYVQDDRVLHEIVKQQRGTSYPAVRDSDIKSQLIPLPPQRTLIRIVDAIDLQLERLDAGVTRLQTAKAKLKHYKQAVLKAAVEGTLIYSDITEGKMPQGWKVVPVESVGQIITGNTPSKSIAAYYGGEVPFYKPS